MPRFQTLTPTTDHLEKKHYLHAITFLTFILWLQRCAHPKQGSIESPYVVSWRRNIHDYYSLCTLHTFKNKTCFTYVYDQHTLKTHDIHTFTDVYSRLLFVEAVFFGGCWLKSPFRIIRNGPPLNSATMLSVPDLNPWPFGVVPPGEASGFWIPPTLLFCVGSDVCWKRCFWKEAYKPTRKNCLYIYILYMWYVLPIGWLHATYHLLPESKVEATEACFFIGQEAQSQPFSTQTSKPCFPQQKPQIQARV